MTQVIWKMKLNLHQSTEKKTVGMTKMRGAPCWEVSPKKQKCLYPLSSENFLDGGHRRVLSEQTCCHKSFFYYFVCNEGHSQWWPVHGVAQAGHVGNCLTNRLSPRRLWASKGDWCCSEQSASSVHHFGSQYNFGKAHNNYLLGVPPQYLLPF